VSVLKDLVEQEKRDARCCNKVKNKIERVYQHVQPVRCVFHLKQRAGHQVGGGVDGCHYKYREKNFAGMRHIPYVCNVVQKEHGKDNHQADSKIICNKIHVITPKSYKNVCNYII